MFIKLTKNFFHLNHRGDTIVEVLISITILASVLVSVFVIVNRDLAIELDAHQQNVALNIIQSQLEALRLDINRTSFDQQIQNQPPSPFCINLGSNSYQIATNTNCYFNQNEQYSPVTNSSYQYKVQILATPASSSVPGQRSQDGYNFKFVVNWPTIGGLQSDKNQEVLYYRLYLNPSNSNKT